MCVACFQHFQCLAAARDPPAQTLAFAGGTAAIGAAAAAAVLANHCTPWWWAIICLLAVHCVVVPASTHPQCRQPYTKAHRIGISTGDSVPVYVARLCNTVALLF